MADLPYTEETHALVERVISEAFGGYNPTDHLAARRVLDALSEAGLLVTPRIQQDVYLHARAYIWRPPGAEPMVLNPVEVDVVLPQHPAEWLAARYFDEEQAPGLRSDGMPPDGIAHLRQRYIRDAVANPEAVRQLREHFGEAS